MLLIIIYLVFISFIINFIFSNYLGNRFSNIISNLCMLSSTIFIIIIIKYIIIHNYVFSIHMYNMINLEQLNINITILFDSLTIIMLMLVLIVSTCTHIYSIEYMLFDPYQNKFISYLSLFTFFMIILVTSNNLLQLFIGWEGIGICSFLLINFWFTRTQALKASIMAVLVNKIGDITFLIAIGLSFYIFSTLDIHLIIKQSIIQTNHINYSTTIITVLFMISAISKSAQVGLHIWLPEAMEGPTPVSSLIHAATLVTAGIFLITRFNVLFINNINVMVMILLIGSITAFIAASMGLFQNDIKKIIAYSTCSQLGYMFLSCGMNSFNYSIFHLMNHAYFKALLFLTAGYIIHSLNDEQDIRKFGALLNINRYSYILITVSSLSLMGYPFLSGFYSKETLLLSMFNIYILQLKKVTIYNLIYLTQFLAYLTIFFTSIYSIKLISYTFEKSFNGYKLYLYSYHFSTYLTFIPLFILFILSITSGYIFYDLLIGLSTPFWNDSISIPNRNEIILNKIYSININYIYYSHFVHYFTNYIFIYTSIMTIIIFNIKRQMLYELYIQNQMVFIIKTLISNKYLNYQRLIFIIFKITLTLTFKQIYIYIEKTLLEFFGVMILSRHIFYPQYKIDKYDNYFNKINTFLFVSFSIFYIYMY